MPTTLPPPPSYATPLLILYYILTIMTIPTCLVAYLFVNF